MSVLPPSPVVFGVVGFSVWENGRGQPGMEQPPYSANMIIRWTSEANRFARPKVERFNGSGRSNTARCI